MVEDVKDEYDAARERLVDEERYEERVLENDNIDLERAEETAHKWSKWLEDEWYGDITHYLLYGTLKNRRYKDNKRLRKIRLESIKYSLVDTDEDQPILTYREVNGERSKCVFEEDVGKILHRFHDIHGHFSYGIVSRNLMGRYYWPGRIKDVIRWCTTCEACQRFGPLRNSTQVKPIMSLQPMDLMGMDFIGPITPHSLSGSVYILIVVDYFSRYLFAHATQQNTGAAVVEFWNKICKFFGWPLALYVDNGAHFVKGELPKVCSREGVKLFNAPITNPRSVGLAERYVQLVLASLRAAIEADTRVDAMQRWDEHLDAVVQAINTRVLRIHGHTPSELFLGFNIRLSQLDITIEESIRRSLLPESAISEGEGLKDQREVRLARLEEVRELVRDRVLREQEFQEVKAPIPRFQAPQLGDLVLRRRFAVDKSLGMKLHSKWDGPYLLSRISKSGVSGDLTDLKSGRLLGRYAFEALKVFVPRALESKDKTEWVTLLEGLAI